MKNKIFVLILSLFFVAQNVKSQDKSSVRFGVRAGSNFSHMDFSEGSPVPVTPIFTNWEPGFVGGLMVIVPLSKNLYFQPEYLFSQMGGKIRKTSTAYSFDYLSLPVLLRWEIRSFFLTAGPHFDLLINSRKEVEDFISPDAIEMEERNIGFGMGLGFSLWSSFGIEVRYIKGFNHIRLVMDSGVQEFKFNMVEASIFYTLKKN